MSNGAPDPMTLILYNSTGSEAHSITPYALVDKGGGLWWVRVYDNNDPDDSNRYVVITTTNNTWRYNLGGNFGTWSGGANSRSLGAIPISVYAQPPVCPWCGAISSVSAPSSATSSNQVWYTGPGHLLLADSQGRRLGYAGNHLVSEIPLAFGSVLPGGLGIPQEPIYYLPVTDTYSIVLDGQTVTQTSTAAVTQFGPGYAASVEDVILNSTSQDLLSTTPSSEVQH